MSEPLLLTAEHRVALGQNLPYIRWFLGHSGDLSAIVADLGTIVNSSETLNDRIAAAQHLLGLLGPIIGDFPAANSVSAVSAEACQAFETQLHEGVAAGRFDGTLIKNLIQILVDNGPAIIAFIQAIAKIFAVTAV